MWQTRWHHLVAPSPLLEVLQGCQVWEYLRKPSALSTPSASGHSASRKVGATCTVFSIVLQKNVFACTWKKHMASRLWQCLHRVPRKPWEECGYYRIIFKKNLKKVHLASRPTQVERRTNREPAEYLNTWRYNAIYETRIAMYLNTKNTNNIYVIQEFPYPRIRNYISWVRRRTPRKDNVCTVFWSKIIN